MPEHHPPSPEIPEGFVALLKVEGGEAVDFSPLVVTELEALPVRMKTPLE